MRHKWLIICNYNPHKTMTNGYLGYVNKDIDFHSLKYDNFLPLGDFNSETTEEATKSFCQIHNFENLLDNLTLYNPHLLSPNHLCFNLMITNKPRIFRNSCTIEIGFYAFHKMTLTVTLITFCKTESKSNIAVAIISSTILSLEIKRQINFGIQICK